MGKYEISWGLRREVERSLVKLYQAAEETLVRDGVYESPRDDEALQRWEAWARGQRIVAGAERSVEPVKAGDLIEEGGLCFEVGEVLDQESWVEVTRDWLDPDWMRGSAGLNVIGAAGLVARHWVRFLDVDGGEHTWMSWLGDGMGVCHWGQPGYRGICRRGADGRKPIYQVTVLPWDTRVELNSPDEVCGLLAGGLTGWLGEVGWYGAVTKMAWGDGWGDVDWTRGYGEDGGWVSVDPLQLTRGDYVIVGERGQTIIDVEDTRWTISERVRGNMDWLDYRFRGVWTGGWVGEEAVDLTFTSSSVMYHVRSELTWSRLGCPLGAYTGVEDGIDSMVYSSRDVGWKPFACVERIKRTEGAIVFEMDFSSEDVRVELTPGMSGLEVLDSIEVDDPIQKVLDAVAWLTSTDEEERRMLGRRWKWGLED